jgi:uncharacterized UPF0146 family protein
MKDKVFLIGAGNNTEIIQESLKEKGIDLVVVDEKSIPQALSNVKPFVIKPTSIIPEIKWEDYEDGKTKRRARRKLKRKQHK